MKLLEAIKAMRKINPEAILSDGTQDWDLDNLEDAVTGCAEPDNRDYHLDETGIQPIDSAGYLMGLHNGYKVLQTA